MRRNDLLAMMVVPFFICSIYVGGPDSGGAGAPPRLRDSQTVIRTLRARAARDPVVARSLTARATPGSYGDCGPDARPETGLQGQVPQADQASGRSKLGARCNLRLVGQVDIGGRGANYQLAWHGNCAYVGMAGQTSQAPGGPKETDQPLSGVAVIDASDAHHPHIVRMLQSSVGQSEHEAVEVNERRGMLVTEVGGAIAQWIEIYDVSKDCRQPVFKGRYDAGSPKFHGLRIAPDGLTVYASDTTGPASLGRVLQVLDVTDMTQPRLITTWGSTDVPGSQPFAIHDLDVSESGNRLYLGTIPVGLGGKGIGVPGEVPGTGPTVVVLDSSAIQRRAATPQLRVVSQLDTYPNFGHTIQAARIGGTPYLFTSGEVPFTGSRCPWGWGTVVDFRNELQPTPISEIKLQVNELGNCSKVNQDGADYSIHYAGVDDPNNTSKIFYTWYSSGLRIFDVRHPASPREVAYYKPPPKESTVFKPMTPGGAGFDAQNASWDAATSVVRYLPQARQLWFVSVANGFQILQLTTPAAKRSHPQPTLELSVRPQTTRPQRLTRFRFLATYLDGGVRRRVGGAKIRFRRKVAFTDRNGRAMILARFTKRGRYEARAVKHGFRSGKARVKVVLRRAGV